MPLSKDRVVMRQNAVSVIIPCFNEGKRIIPIIQEIKKSPFAKEIIVIDDGSGERTKAILRSIDSIALITLKYNKGKSEALYAGVKKAKFDSIVFIDSDLVGLTSHHVTALVRSFISGDYDMLLGNLEKEVWLFKLLGLATAFTGERVIRKNLLMKYHTEIFKGGYLIEPALNRIFFSQYRVGKVTLHGVGQVYKIYKNGFLGLWADIKMHWEYIKFLGIFGYFYQGYCAIKF